MNNFPNGVHEVSRIFNPKGERGLWAALSSLLTTGQWDVHILAQKMLETYKSGMSVKVTAEAQAV